MTTLCCPGLNLHVFLERPRSFLHAIQYCIMFDVTVTGPQTASWIFHATYVLKIYIQYTIDYRNISNTYQWNKSDDIVLLVTNNITRKLLCSRLKKKKVFRTVNTFTYSITLTSYFHNKAKKVCIKTRSPSTSLPSITVKWPIPFSFCA